MQYILRTTMFLGGWQKLSQKFEISNSSLDNIPGFAPLLFTPSIIFTPMWSKVRILEFSHFSVQIRLYLRRVQLLGSYILYFYWKNKICGGYGILRFKILALEHPSQNVRFQGENMPNRSRGCLKVVEVANVFTGRKCWIFSQIFNSNQYFQ